MGSGGSGRGSPTHRQKVMSNVYSARVSQGSMRVALCRSESGKPRLEEIKKHGQLVLGRQEDSELVRVVDSLGKYSHTED